MDLESSESEESDVNNVIFILKRMLVQVIVDFRPLVLCSSPVRKKRCIDIQPTCLP